jgi:dihydrofolate reductase
MRNIMAATFVTLDGVMQAPGGPEEDPSGGFKFGGWLAGLEDDGIGPPLDELFRQPFDLLLGRRTYDIFAAYWPFIATDPAAPGYEPGTAGIASAFNRVTKYVATHRPDSLDWENSQWVGKDPVAGLRDLKQGDGPMLLIQGSSELIHTLLAHDLIDEIRLIVAPLMLGKGKRLFDDGTMPRSLKLVKFGTTERGTLLANYEPAGEVKVGTFGADSPSEVEVERRRKLKEADRPA